MEESFITTNTKPAGHASIGGNDLKKGTHQNQRSQEVIHSKKASSLSISNLSRMKRCPLESTESEMILESRYQFPSIKEMPDMIFKPLLMKSSKQEAPLQYPLASDSRF